MAAATAIVRKADRNLLAENGEHITITTNWAKSLLYKINSLVPRPIPSFSMLHTEKWEATE